MNVQDGKLDRQLHQVLPLRTHLRAGLPLKIATCKEKCEGARDLKNFLCFLAVVGGYDGDCWAKDSELQSCYDACK